MDDHEGGDEVEDKTGAKVDSKGDKFKGADKVFTNRGDVASVPLDSGGTAAGLVVEGGDYGRGGRPVVLGQQWPHSLLLACRHRVPGGGEGLPGLPGGRDGRVGAGRGGQAGTRHLGGVAVHLDRVGV